MESLQNSINKKELAKRLNITTKTLYNWEENKPELIKLIKLGLEREKEIGIKETIDIAEVLKQVQELAKEVKKLKEKN